MSEIYSIIVYNIDTNISIHFMPDSACWGVVPPIPELTSGRKVEGTETRCHSMTEIGIYFPDDRPKKLLHNACYMHAWLLCGSASRLGLHGHWVAAQVMWTKALPALLLYYPLSPYFPSLCFFTITQHTHTHTHTLAAALCPEDRISGSATVTGTLGKKS